MRDVHFLMLALLDDGYQKNDQDQKKRKEKEKPWNNLKKKKRKTDYYCVVL